MASRGVLALPSPSSPLLRDPWQSERDEKDRSNERSTLLPPSRLASATFIELAFIEISSRWLRIWSFLVAKDFKKNFLIYLFHNVILTRRLFDVELEIDL